MLYSGPPPDLEHEHGSLHVDEDLVITGTASLGTKWYACIEVFLPTGKVPDGGCLLVNHFGDGSPVSETLHLGFNLPTLFGVPVIQIGPDAAANAAVLHVLLTVEAHGGGVTANNTQLLYNRIDLSQTAYIRQTLPPGWTFASSSGFLSESPFNSPDPSVSVPEPSSFALLGGGLALLACLRRSAWRSWLGGVFAPGQAAKIRLEERLALRLRDCG